MSTHEKNQFIAGLRDGFPIMLGYLPVSFTYGSFAAAGGLSIGITTAISLTNITSSGQFAATNLILTGGSVVEIIFVTLIINIRYLLMGLSLSQKLEPEIPLWKKAIFAYGITDETFAVSSMRKEPVTFSYMSGLILLPIFGWTFGTFLGAVAAGLLPEDLKSALNIALYAMFICLIIPPAKHHRMVLLVVVISAALSCLFYYVPVFQFLSQGWAVIVTAVLGAAIGAAVTCVKKEETGQ